MTLFRNRNNNSRLFQRWGAFLVTTRSKIYVNNGIRASEHP
jgi:hypothetical protein